MKKVKQTKTTSLRLVTIGLANKQRRSLLECVSNLIYNFQKKNNCKVIKVKIQAQKFCKAKATLES